MPSPEQISLPEKNSSEQPLEQVPKPEADPLARLRKLLEKPEAKEEPKEKSITVGKLEEFKKFLEALDTDKFIRMPSPHELYSRSWDWESMSPSKQEALKETAEEEDRNRALVKEFLSAKDNLNSKSKRKLWDQIYKETWLKKIERSFQELEHELEILELRKKDLQMKKGKPVLLKEGEEEKLRHGFPGPTKEESIARLTAGLQTLRDFGFDEEKLKDFEARLKKAKRT